MKKIKKHAYCQMNIIYFGLFLSFTKKEYVCITHTIFRWINSDEIIYLFASKNIYKITSFFSTECQDLIAQCLRIEAAQRILLEDVLRHPWMLQDGSNNGSVLPNSDTNSSSQPSVMTSSLNSTTNTTPIGNLNLFFF